MAAAVSNRLNYLSMAWTRGGTGAIQRGYRLAVGADYLDILTQATGFVRLRRSSEKSRMQTRFNSEILDAIRAADARGATRAEMRELYIWRNALDIDLDCPVYRIAEYAHVVADIESGCYTSNRIDKKVWGDKSENPLLNRPIDDLLTGDRIWFDGVVADVFGSSWSTACSDDGPEWRIFTRNQPGVRMHSTARKLLDASMSPCNRFAMNQHFVGAMQYADAAVIEDFFSDPLWEKHLDDQGHGITSSFLRLSDDLAYEREVRLLYHHSSDLWARRAVQVRAGLASIPFAWAKALDRLVVGAGVTDEEVDTITERLRAVGSQCPVERQSMV
ncbi:hypothetical protein P3W23_09300 [Luteibacter sp. PPL554]